MERIYNAFSETFGCDGGHDCFRRRPRTGSRRHVRCSSGSDGNIKARNNQAPYRQEACASQEGLVFFNRSSCRYQHGAREVSSVCFLKIENRRERRRPRGGFFIACILNEDFLIVGPQKFARQIQRPAYQHAAHNIRRTRQLTKRLFEVRAQRAFFNSGITGL